MPAEPGLDSYLNTATAQAIAQGKKVKVYGVIINGGTGASSVELKTGGSGGTSKFKLDCNANDAHSAILPHPVTFTDGVHATLTGSGADYVIFYRLLP